mmetsp:Transcript_1807/g.4200  ORF Transcript_1807/g.4200 Transcript_1807/m.4200 type:complete len:122 (+) Transcript_1807:40-405(+)|eukprot:CAMPEP_0171489884 /NCGR_PEP_ID=MMETSP0958-20121227/3008_1 /TAXON_ID=87120 /ORGANISM="Aurantiochytrium limacinum, Strain ATCCMYA-1381" /LENGTH=121 /DNA_ID=CAMNT_0012023153 /DNA_START=39 /DNA_END=404 /DNA_ORIENTATION=-
MPFISVLTNVPLTLELKHAAGKALIQAIADGFGKPTASVTVNVEFAEGLMTAGTAEPCAMANIQGIGGELSQALKPVTDALHKELSIPEDRISMNMVSFDASMWGRSGITVAEARAAAANK